MTRSVWLKADNSVGEWETRKQRITTGLEAGVDWVLVDEADITRVRRLGDVNVAAFYSDTETSIIDNAEVDSMDAQTPEAYIIGKDAEGDATIDLPDELSSSADLTALRRNEEVASGAYIRILSEQYETFAQTVAEEAHYTIVI